MASTNRTGGVAAKEEEMGREDTTDHRRVDYLTPFLANVKDPGNMTKDEARHVRDSCLKALKERCVAHGRRLSLFCWPLLDPPLEHS
jgi:hypothetical protein